jgi:DNA ligase-1
VEVEPAVCWLAGSLRQGRIGLGPAAVRRARPAATSAPQGLEVAAVERRFQEIAALSGPGSTRERERLLGELLGRAGAEEQSFLTRLVLGELRQGALEGLMAEAVARAAELPLGDVRRALMLSGDLPAVAGAALARGAAGLARFRLELFRPLQPMLAQPVDDLGAAFERLERAAVETKLDGARIQVHRAGDDVRVFSRRLNDVTAALPEVVETVRALGARELVLDGEVLALSPDGAPRPFQVTMRRFGRRLDVERLRGELPLTPFFFDVLMIDGEPLLDRPAAARFAALDEAAPGWTVARRLTGDPAEAEAFLDRSLEAGHEGVMLKALDSGYEAGSRGSAWLKFKPAHSLDLVVLAAEWGSGRRRGWLSNLHLGALDPASGGFVMLGKTFKGLTDEMLAWQTQELQRIEVARDAHVVYVRPVRVVEVAFGDVQRSPQYPAGMALRFARVRRYRPDKSPQQADTVDAVRAILERRRAEPQPVP